eukprot:5042237-Pleurochrysis_carterae.AAC.3
MAATRQRPSLGRGARRWMGSAAMVASRILNLTLRIGSSQRGPSRQLHWKPCTRGVGTRAHKPSGEPTRTRGSCGRSSKGWRRCEGEEKGKHAVLRAEEGCGRESARVCNSTRPAWDELQKQVYLSYDLKRRTEQRARNLALLMCALASEHAWMYARERASERACMHACGRVCGSAGSGVGMACRMKSLMELSSPLSTSEGSVSSASTLAPFSLGAKPHTERAASRSQSYLQRKACARSLPTRRAPWNADQTARATFAAHADSHPSTRQT